MAPEEFDEPLTPEEQREIDNLSPGEMGQLAEGLMSFDPKDDGYDAKEGVFRPKHKH